MPAADPASLASATAGSAPERIAATAAGLQQALAGRPPPACAVLLGSGWGALAQQLDDAQAWPYAELPAFAPPGVPGHDGRLWWGRLQGHPVWVLAGRAHAYETGDAAAMRGALRTLAALGVHTLVQTNAAGSLRLSVPAGQMMLVADHLNLVQRSPLVADVPGPGAPASPFVDLRDAYDPALRRLAQGVARRHGLALHEGVYAWMLGPQFETPAEVRMLQALGADAVGMSTVPETVLARHAGMRVLALSLITNLACGLGPHETLSHQATLAQAEASGAAAVGFLRDVLLEVLAQARPAAD
jgi:purine-nucleoside phosphorylase